MKDMNRCGCGSLNVGVWGKSSETHDWWQVCCDDCGRSGPKEKTIDAAVESWNNDFSTSDIELDDYIATVASYVHASVYRYYSYDSIHTLVKNAFESVENKS